MLGDAEYMDRALFMAARGRGRTTPNPMVGAVVVSASGVVVGSGYHERAGEPHAEVHALRAAGDATRGATLYCTLEPCCHHGRTPPCVDAIVDAGIARVVMAINDPNPRVAGGGAKILRDRGLRVDVGLGRNAALRLNKPFFSAIKRKRPWVTAKTATSLDGMVASAPGVRTRLSGADSDRLTQLLRAEVDAVGVGSGTLLSDDPLLTVRDVYRERPLARVVFDRRLRTRSSARVFGTLASGPLLILTSAAAIDANLDRARDLERAGARLVSVSGTEFEDSLRALLSFGIHALLLEGGPTLHQSAWAAGMVDTVRVIVAPRTLGPGGVPWLPSWQMSIPALHDVRIEPCGSDVMIEGDVYRLD